MPKPTGRRTFWRPLRPTSPHVTGPPPTPEEMRAAAATILNVMSHQDPADMGPALEHLRKSRLFLQDLAEHVRDGRYDPEAD